MGANNPSSRNGAKKTQVKSTNDFLNLEPNFLMSRQAIFFFFNIAVNLLVKKKALFARVTLIEFLVNGGS